MSSCNMDGRFSRLGSVFCLPETDQHTISVQPIHTEGQYPEWHTFNLPVNDAPTTTAFNFLEKYIEASLPVIIDFQVKLDDVLLLEVRRDASARRGFRVMSRKALV